MTLPVLLRFLRIALITDPLAALCVVLSGVTSVVFSLFDSKGNVQHVAVTFWARMLLFAGGVKAKVTGLENIRRDGCYVFVSNHISMADVPVVMTHLPLPFRFLAKESLFRFPFIGWHLRRGGHIRVVREDKRASVKALSRARRVLDKGISVLVFAEGSRSGGQLRAFKAGAAHIAIKTGVSVVPLGVAGTDAVLPKGSIHIRPGQVRLHVGEPILTASLTSRDHASLTEQIQARVSALIEEAASR